MGKTLKISDPDKIEEAKKYYVELGIGRAAEAMDVSYEAMRKFGIRFKLKTEFKQNSGPKIKWSKEEKAWLSKEIEGMQFNDDEKTYRVLSKMLFEKFNIKRTTIAVKTQISALRLHVPTKPSFSYKPFYSIEERDAASEKNKQEELNKVGRVLKEYFDKLASKIEERSNQDENKINIFEELSIP